MDVSSHEEVNTSSPFSSKEERLRETTQPISDRAELKFRVSDHKSSSMFIRAASQCVGVQSGQSEGE